MERCRGAMSSREDAESSQGHRQKEPWVLLRKIFGEGTDIDSIFQQDWTG